jgi:[Skp1-protein]-hydroxyproline N-acetylglucosaminyltransferase
LTTIYYLTEPDWDASLDGGALRVFGTDGDDDDDDDDYTDITPHRGRLVMFRSDRVEHQVMPSLRRPRTAITVWFYGSMEKTTTEQTAPSVSLPPPLLLQATPIRQSSRESSKIFVSIPSFRDSETVPTLNALFATAHNPERIFCGVVLQLEDGESHDETIWEQIVSLAKTNANVRYVRLHSKDAMGPCYARGLSQMLHRGEDYVLQIDAHMRFRPNWDEYLIQQHQALVDSTNNPKVMLTTYPIGYTLPNNIPRDETRGTVLVPWKFDDAGMLRQRGRLIKSKSEYKHSGPQPHGASPLAQHCLFAGGFNFAPSRVLTDVPYDTMGLPFLFFGEELSMAVRLYTNGYDLYAPRETVCYHLWSRSHRPTPRIGSKEKEQEKSRQKTESQAIVVKQLLGDPSMVGAALGLGCERTAEEFADRLGVNFAQQNFVREGWENGDLTTEDFVGGGSSAVSSPDSLEAKIATLDPNSKAMATLAKFLGNM